MLIAAFEDKRLSSSKPCTAALLALFSAFCLGTAAAADTITPGNHSRTLETGKTKRNYVVHIPPGYTGQRPVPIVIVLHGALCNSSIIAWDTRMSRRADQDGFIAVYPNGTGITEKRVLVWNAGSCCGTAKIGKTDDIAFLRAMISQMQNEFNVDRNRIYVAGVSNGGMMAYRAGLELSDLIAAIAPVEGCMMSKPQGEGYPVSVIAFHGTGDRIIPYKGGRGGIFGFKVVASGVKENIDFWVKRNRCSSTPDREERGDLIKEAYRNGDAGTEVCLYTLKGGRHSWPGGRRSFFSFYRANPPLCATDAMCEFFWKHPKAAPTAGTVLNAGEKTNDYLTRAKENF